MSKIEVKKLEEAIEICRKIIKQNNEIVRQTRKNKDTNAMQLTANCDKESIAIERLIKYVENSIPKQTIKEELKETELPNIIVGGRRNGKTLEYGKRLGKMEAYKELLGVR